MLSTPLNSLSATGGFELQQISVDHSNHYGIAPSTYEHPVSGETLLLWSNNNPSEVTIAVFKDDGSLGAPPSNRC
jgi:hypothetical protein